MCVVCVGVVGVCVCVCVGVHVCMHNSAMKKKEILLFVTTWTDLEGIILSELSDRGTQNSV